jgi:virulence factor Mce-like protein
MLKDLLRYRIDAARLGMVLMAVFAALLVGAYMVNRTYNLTFFLPSYELKADFTDADGIANSSDVRIAGTWVGQVTKIEPKPGGLAELTFRIDPKQVPLHQGSRVALRLQTLLGAKFLEITPGPASAPELHSGDVIGSQSTQSPVDFDQILQQFDPKTRQNLAGIVQEGGAATNGQGENLNALLGDLHSLSVDHLAGTQTHLNQVLGTIADNDAAFKRFISEGNASLGHGLNQFSGEHQNINDTVAQLRPALDKLNPTLEQVNTLSTQLGSFTRIMDVLQADIVSAVSGWNHNANNTSCGAPGCGGFYLQQPSILANAPADTEHYVAGAAGAGTTGRSRGGSRAGSPATPYLPPLPGVPNVTVTPDLAQPSLPLPGGRTSPGAVPQSDQDAALQALFDFLLR